MFSRVLGFIFKNLYMRFFQAKVRRGSLKAVRGYVKSVEMVRLGLIGLVALGAAAAIFIVGIVLAVTGFMALAPVDPRAMALTALIVGVLLAAIAGVIMVLVFNQKRWLRLSRAYDLMEAALAPWPGSVPPNPLHIIKKRQHLSAIEYEFDKAKRARDLEGPSGAPESPLN